MIEPTPYSLLKKGSFLIATPEIASGMFARSVILICEHSPVGSFGLIVNKPLHIDLPEDLLDLKHLSNPNVHLRAAGPIQPNQMMLLHSALELEQTLKVCEGVFLGGDLEFLQDSTAKSDGPSILLCFGYCGWGPGLLERDFMNGSWILSSANSNYIFETPSERLWQQTLRDKGGKYTTLSLIPEDLNLN
jgi:putative transcriptional regulator